MANLKDLLVNGSARIIGKTYSAGGFVGDLDGTAKKSTQDSAGQQINTTYIKDLSVSGKTITVKKGDGTTSTITTQDTTYTHPTYTAKSSGLYKVTVDGTGHVSATAAVTKDDITALGIPGSDTNTDTKMTQTANSGSTALPILIGASASPSGAATGAYAAGVTVTPSTKTITATTFKGALSGNASTATKATQDSAGQQINTTYIKGLSVSGKTITYTKGDDTTGTITTQDTTYGVATTSANGLMSKDDKSKLDGIAAGAQVNTVTGVKGNSESSYRTGNINITAANVGLGNVTNESKATMFTSPTFTGTPKAPTASAGDSSTQIATTAFVQTAVANKIAAADAMIFKGTIGSSGATVTALPDSHTLGWTYKVATAGTYAGVKCEVGDMIICVTTGTSANNAHWTVVQTNIDGAVTGPASAVDARVAVFNGTTGKVIKDSGYTIAASVPSGAKFTDTVYTHPSYSAASSGLYKVTVDATGHVSATAAVTKADITGLGIPGSDTDTKMTQTANSGSTALPILIGASASPSGAATGAYAAGVTITPSTKTITATTFAGALSGNASTATKATQDSAGQQINTTYIKGLSVSGKTVTYTKGDGTTGTITTQDTVYSLPAATASALGGVKVGSNITVSSGTISVSKANVTNALGYTPPKRLVFTNKVVATSDWVADETYTGFGYKAAIACSGVTADYLAEVIFNVDEVIAGIYAPVNETGSGTVTIWASELPSADITIPTISCLL